MHTSPESALRVRDGHRLCEAVYALADGADLLLIEATYLVEDAMLAAEYGHLAAAQAARVATECVVAEDLTGYRCRADGRGR